MQVTNPVLPGFHPDPSILRVGDWYYIANSTFEWYPGVELHRSRDLVTWESLPSPLDERRLLDMDGAVSSCGVWAPCLTWADGLFWLIFTNVRSWNAGPWKDTPNYLTTAPSIEGPWSDPVYLNSSGFDPSLFHDDDGTKWLVNMEWDYRRAGSRQFSGILIQRYSPARRKLVGPVKKIFLGSHIGLVEGPHVYKRNGWYYVMAAEGGTWLEHAVTLARSRNREGPYELHPQNPLLSSYGHDEISIQKAGHGSWCDTPDGRTYLAFLCGRPLPGTERCVLGRETSIVELEWHDDWPYVKPPSGMPLHVNGVYRNYPTDTFESPSGIQGGAPVSTNINETITYRFDAEISGDFKNLRVARDPAVYSLKARAGFLRLRGGQSPVSPYSQTLLARRQTCFDFQAETKMEFKPESYQHLAGLTWRYDEQNQYLLYVSLDGERGRVINVMTFVAGESKLWNEVYILETGPVWLGVTARGSHGRFRYSLDGMTWVELRPVLDASVLSDEFDGLGFTGAFVGMFCVDTVNYTTCADFEYFSYIVD